MTRQRPPTGASGTRSTATSGTARPPPISASTTIDGETRDGKTYQRVEDRYSAWSVKHDNRLVQNDETVTKKVVSYEETYNQIETLTSLDILQRFSCNGFKVSSAASAGPSPPPPRRGRTPR